MRKKVLSILLLVDILLGAESLKLATESHSLIIKEYSTILFFGFLLAAGFIAIILYLGLDERF